MTKVLHVCALMMFVFYNSFGQNKTELPKNNIKSETKGVTTSYGPNSMVRTIKQDRNGNIWHASYQGVFRK